MGGIFGGPKIPTPKPPPPPKPVRLPTDQDPEVIAAGRRRRGSALERRGRRSTILTSNLSGSGGEKLGN